MSHECFIGMLHKFGDSDLTTVSELKKHIEEKKMHNKNLSEFGIEIKVWSMKDYTDKRKRTDLTRYEYCPECGKKIDWEALRKEEPV